MKFWEVRHHEWPGLGWSTLWFFCVLGAYYALRPVRETFGVELGVGPLRSLFAITLLATIVVLPLYSTLTRHVRRRWLVPLVYGFLSSHLVIFWMIFTQDDGDSTKAWRWVFIVWLSVFNLFAVTLFWSTLVDLFQNEQAKRLFGLVAGAGTLGGIFGSQCALHLVAHVGLGELFWIPILLLSLSIFSAWRLRHWAVKHGTTHATFMTESWSLRDLGAGLDRITGSHYLTGLALLIVLISICGTSVYFQMIELVGQQISDRSKRTAWFAELNSWQLLCTLLIQTSLASYLIRRFGMPLTLSLLSAVYLLGFSVMALLPLLAVLGTFDVMQRVVQFSIGVPAREVLFTVVPTDDKYRAKALIDTAGKRTGDVAAAQGYAILNSTGWAPTSLAVISLLPALAVGLVALWLGRQYGQREQKHFVTPCDRTLQQH